LDDHPVKKYTLNLFVDKKTSCERKTK